MTQKTVIPLPAQILAWLPIIIGLAVLYVPSLVDLFTGIWSSDEQMHRPIVLGISLWLYRWMRTEQIAKLRQFVKIYGGLNAHN